MLAGTVVLKLVVLVAALVKVVSSPIVFHLFIGNKMCGLHIVLPIEWLTSLPKDLCVGKAVGNVIGNDT